MDSDDGEIGDFGIYDVLTDAGVMRMEQVKMNEGLKDHVVDVAAVVVEYLEGIQHRLPN